MFYLIGNGKADESKEPFPVTSILLKPFKIKTYLIFKIEKSFISNIF
jgi:hypothetical protein